MLLRNVIISLKCSVSYFSLTALMNKISAQLTPLLIGQKIVCLASIPSIHNINLKLSPSQPIRLVICFIMATSTFCTCSGKKKGPLRLLFLQEVWFNLEVSKRHFSKSWDRHRDRHCQPDWTDSAAPVNWWDRTWKSSANSCLHMLGHLWSLALVVIRRLSQRRGQCETGRVRRNE